MCREFGCRKKQGKILGRRVVSFFFSIFLSWSNFTSLIFFQLELAILDHDQNEPNYNSLGGQKKGLQMVDGAPPSQ